jgi:hypothetical protein
MRPLIVWGIGILSERHCQLFGRSSSGDVGRSRKPVHAAPLDFTCHAACRSAREPFLIVGAIAGGWDPLVDPRPALSAGRASPSIRLRNRPIVSLGKDGRNPFPARESEVAGLLTRPAAGLFDPINRLAEVLDPFQHEDLGVGFVGGGEVA